MTLHVNKIESSSPKEPLWHVWQNIEPVVLKSRILDRHTARQKDVEQNLITHDICKLMFNNNIPALM